MHTEYKCFSGSVFTFPSNDFSGYKVVFQPNGRLWRIDEIKKSVSTGFSIKFWPSATSNNINTIVHNTGMYKWFTINGKLSQIVHQSTDGSILNGECHFYDNSVSIKYFSNNIDVTDEVYDIVSNRTQFSIEDKFNLYIKYGSEFKLYDDYNIDIDYQQIINFCSK